MSDSANTSDSMSNSVTIGLEVHMQLKTRTKLFCACAVPAPNVAPNSCVCPICLGYPGSKPLLNDSALVSGVRLGVSLGGTIAPSVVFARKVYFYPDLAKNYQITQFDTPLALGGNVKLRDGTLVTLERIHLEEDPASLVHEDGLAGSSVTLIDYNRSGIPLLEIVTTPCLRSPKDAREFLKELLSVARYLGIHEDSLVLKADANVSTPGHARVEIKNIGSFREVERALNYEIVRQQREVRLGKKRETNGSGGVHTRAWDGSKTLFLRSKETSEDYGYILDPDLVPFVLSADQVSSLCSDLPELAHVKEQRFVATYGIDAGDAEVLCQDPALAHLFEACVQQPDVDAVFAARFIRREVLRVLNYHTMRLDESYINADRLVRVMQLERSGAISDTISQRLVELLAERDVDPDTYVRAEGLERVSSDEALRAVCQGVLSEFASAVSDYRSGEEKALHYLVGQVMRKTRGAADASAVRRVLLEMMRKA